MQKLIQRFRGEKIGLFGGSFNPPHFGHLRVARSIVRFFRLDRLFWLVVPQNPFKSGKPQLPIQTRIELCNKFIGKSQKMEAIDFETGLKTFETINTLKKAKRTFPNAKLFWIMGSDNLFSFHKWRGAGFIMRNVNILLYIRGNFHKALRTQSFVKYKGRFKVFYGKKFNISSTEIREKLGKDWHLITKENSK